MIENDLGIKLIKRGRRTSHIQLEDSISEDQNRLLKLRRARAYIAKLEDEIKHRPTNKEFNRIKKKNKKLQVKISDLRYKVQLLESKNKTLTKKLGDGNK